jgi:hypothetical protein
MIKKPTKPSDDSTTTEPKTEADKIWSEIKNKRIEIFSLPSQIVSQYCKPSPVEPSRLYLIVSASSVLPALETALGPSYVLDRMERFVTVSRKV